MPDELTIAVMPMFTEFRNHCQKTTRMKISAKAGARAAPPPERTRVRKKKVTASRAGSINHQSRLKDRRAYRALNSAMANSRRTSE
jgi:hypothetical protein